MGWLSAGDEVLRVPLLDLEPQYGPLRVEILAAVTRVCDSQHFIMGPEVDRLEVELARDLDVAEAIGVSSGTDALLLALMALGIGPGDEVIVPTLSFFATAGSVVRVGATPVFVDVEPGTLTLDIEATRRALTTRTRAIVPVHLYGQCADMAPLGALAAAHGLAIVEDAAQAIGARYAGRAAGALGTVGCFSCFPTKNLGAFGDAGFVTTNDAALAARLRLLRNHGASPKYYHLEVGGNFRLDALQAAVLRVKRPHLPQWNRQRADNAARYRELIAAAGLANRVQLPVAAANRTHTYHQFVVRVPGRDAVRRRLEERGVGTEVYYPVPFHRQACFAGLAGDLDRFPVADAAAREVLALPIYPGLTAEQQRYVVAALGDALS